MTNEKMIIQKTWEEFRGSGLLWLVNRALQIFGWAIVFSFKKDGSIKEVYPARSKFRGFGIKEEAEGFINITDFLKENINSLKADLTEDYNKE